MARYSFFDSDKKITAAIYLWIFYQKDLREKFIEQSKILPKEDLANFIELNLEEHLTTNCSSIEDCSLLEFLGVLDTQKLKQNKNNYLKIAEQFYQ